jgi:hypothetical protein
MFKRVRDFGESRATDFLPTGLIGQMLAVVVTAIAALADSAAAQEAANSAVRVNSATKARLRAVLQEDLRLMNRAVRVIARQRPDLKKKFQLGHRGDERLLAAARAFAAEGESLAAEFTKHELPPDFLVKFKNDIDAFEAAVKALNQSIDARVKARALMADAVASGMDAVHHLDVAIRNKYAADKATLLAWQTASHIERHPGRSKKTTTAGQALADLKKPDHSTNPLAD